MKTCLFFFAIRKVFFPFVLGHRKGISSLLFGALGLNFNSAQLKTPFRLLLHFLSHVSQRMNRKKNNRHLLWLWDAVVIRSADQAHLRIIKHLLFEGAPLLCNEKGRMGATECGTHETAFSVSSFFSQQLGRFFFRGVSRELEGRLSNTLLMLVPRPPTETRATHH